MDLGPGEPDRSVVPFLAAKAWHRLFPPLCLTDKRSGALCAAGLWLAFNHLDESHTIAQSHESPNGNYWHAIMHRREGDFWDSKYWFRRVGDHPIATSLQTEATRI